MGDHRVVGARDIDNAAGVRDDSGDNELMVAHEAITISPYLFVELDKRDIYMYHAIVENSEAGIRRNRMGLGHSWCKCDHVEKKHDNSGKIQ